MDLSPLPWQRGLLKSLQALRGRQAQALLLHGPAGMGKLQLALAFSASALCETAEAAEGATSAVREACGTCAACAMLRAGSHPDLRVITPDALAHLRPSGLKDDGEDAELIAEAPETTTDHAEPGGRGAKASRDIRIEQVLEVTRQSAVTTHRGGVRMVILVPAEALNSVSANALLKTLEEPPGDTVFVLITASPHDLLPTIVSRCLHVAAPAVPRPEALAWLIARGLSPSEAANQLDAAGGAPLLALTPTLEQLDATTRRELLNILRQGPLSDPAAVATVVGRQTSIAAAITLFQRWAVDLSTVRYANRVLYHHNEVEALKTLTEQLSSAKLFEWVDSLRDLRRQAEHPLNARLMIEQAIFNYRQVFLPIRQSANLPKGQIHARSI